MRVRKDQQGFTIVEVLIAAAILSIVVLTVCAFILVGSRSYATANSDINVQQEAQLSLNQMSDVLIDTTRSVNYVGYDAGGNPEKALKDAEFSFTPQDKSLVMYNGVVEEDMSGGTPTTEVKEGNGNKHYHFYWSKDAEKLYYAQLDVLPGDLDMTNIASRFPAPPTYDPSNPTALPTGWVELASHVTDFSVDLTQVEEKRVVMLALTFLDGRKEYVTSNNVTIRNKVGVNDAELSPLDRKKKLDVKIMDAPILEPGEEFHFSIPKVTGSNVADKSVTWTVTASASPTGGTTFIDPTNGILKVAVDEPAGTVKVAVTTNAKDSEDNQASCPADVYIKRVTTVTLSLTDSSDAETDDSLNEVCADEEFTIGAAVGGNKLGVQCNGCTEDISHDHDVVNWRITEGAEFVEPEPGGSDYRSAKYRVKAGVTEGTVIKIMATSYLGLPTSRRYPAVDGEITLKVAKSKETADPYKGKLQYGVQTLDKSVTDGLPTDYNQYVTAVRVKDNSGKEPDKILLHYTTGGGADYRISPDLFDLNLNGSYTFYMQAIFPIPEDKYVPGQGGYGKVDDNATIWKEYYKNIQGHTASEGYTGTRYRHSKVFYAKLDKPKLGYEYPQGSNIWYTGKNITYDPVNIYTVNVGSGIVGEIRPWKFENIVDDHTLWDKISNSLYEGEGDSLSGWKGLYYADENSIVVHTDNNGNESYSFNYHGENTLADGAVQIDPKGSMFMKLNSSNNLQKACGNYHIVPGMVYRNLDPGLFEIIGYDGFDFPNLKREARYYTFDDSTIHVRVTDAFTMDIKHPDFTGQAMFPLPKEMANNPLFPNIHSLEWQTTGSKLKVKAKRDNKDNVEDLTFNYVRYRYIKSDNAWEVEPIRHEYNKETKKIRVHSYGTYKCGENGKKWECLKTGGTTEKEFTIQRFDFNNGRYRADFPLPTDGDFPFVDGAGEIERTLELFDSNMNQAQNVPTFLVSCKKNGDEYEIEFRTEARENPNNENNHKIKVNYYGTYTWSPNKTEWKWESGYRPTDATDFVPTLRDLKLPDGKTYMMDYPLPTDRDFQFKNSGDIIRCNGEKAYDQINDSYAADVKEPFKDQGIEAKYTVTGGTHTIQFYKKEKYEPYNASSHKYKTTTYGLYDWTSGSDRWILRSGSEGKEEFSTDFKPTLFITIKGTEYQVQFPLPSESAFDRYKNAVVDIGTWEVPLYEASDTYAEKPKQVNEWAKVTCTQNGSIYTLIIADKSWGSSTVYGTYTCSQDGAEWTPIP